MLAGNVGMEPVIVLGSLVAFEQSKFIRFGGNDGIDPVILLPKNDNVVNELSPVTPVISVMWLLLHVNEVKFGN